MSSRALLTARRCSRRAMTLVELLVVTSIMVTLLALVVVGVRNARPRQSQTADDLASMLAAAQARGLGVPEGAGVILAGGTASTGGYDAEMQPLIDATVTGLPPADPSVTAASVTVSPLNGGDVLRGYRIQVAGRTDPRVSPAAPWLGFVPATATTGTVGFRAGVGQTAANTVWPRPPAGGGLDAQIMQYPVRSSAVLPFDDTVAVDLRFSGVGDDRTVAGGRFDGQGSIGVVFDRVGRVAEVLLRVPEPGAAVPAGAVAIVPSAAIYFLVALRTTIDSGGNTLASADSTWVAVAPQTGRVFVADNVPQSGTDIVALRAARAKARQGLAVGK